MNPSDRAGERKAGRNSGKPRGKRGWFKSRNSQDVDMKSPPPDPPCTSEGPSTYRLSPFGIQAMIHGDPFPQEPLVVRVTLQCALAGSKHLLATLTDCSHSCDALILAHRTSRKATPLKDNQLVTIQAYVTSVANPVTRKPLICVTKYKQLQVASHNDEFASVTSIRMAPQSKVHLGNFSDFCQRNISLLSKHDWAGRNSFAIKNKIQFLESLELVDNWYRQFKLIQDSISSAPADSIFAKNNSTFQSCLQEYSAIQMERFKSIDVPEHQRQGDVLEKALKRVEHMQSFDCFPTVLKELRLFLTGATHLKNVNFRSIDSPQDASSSLVHVPAADLDGAVASLASQLEALEAMLKKVDPDDSGNKTIQQPGLDKGVHILVMASAVAFGVLDICPFLDENEILAHLMTNWALGRFGFPIPFSWYSTAAERGVFLAALDKTRQNLALEPRGKVAGKDLVESTRCAGVLAPMVVLLSERVSHVFRDFESLWEKKLSLISEQEKARAVREARENAAAGMCLICFDQNPNISTLCCGKAVHMNCLAEWLVRSSSCPQCRHEMPTMASLTSRTAARHYMDDDMGEPAFYFQNVSLHGSLSSNESLFTSSSSSSSSSSDEVSMSSSSASSDSSSSLSVSSQSYDSFSDNHSEFENDDEDLAPEESDDEDSVPFQEPRFRSQLEMGPLAAFLNTESPSSRHHIGWGDRTITRQRQQETLVCGRASCRNQAASDCVNYQCGRCCLLHGSLFCERHNS